METILSYAQPMIKPVTYSYHELPYIQREIRHKPNMTYPRKPSIICKWSRCKCRMMRAKGTYDVATSPAVAVVCPDEDTYSHAICMRTRYCKRRRKHGPGIDMLARRSCHSAVFLISPLWTTLERITPENILLGYVNWIFWSAAGQRHAWAECSQSHIRTYKAYCEHMFI